MPLILGVDTSNYTTSLALVDDQGHLVAQERRLLEVATGERGLQQSAAVFQHLTRLPDLLAKLWLNGNLHELKLIAVSTKPRPQEGSYMPVFQVGEGYAQTISTTLGIPLLRTSHQEGHLQAGLWSAQGPQQAEFLAVHISGGTTELLKVQSLSVKEQDGQFFETTLLGGTSDLHAGQFVDRVGVALGLSFPAGPALEQLALQAGAKALAIPSAVQGLTLSFSGPESQAMRLIARGEPGAEIARAVEQCIATTLEKVLRQAIQETGLKNVLIVGGVAANQYLRQRLQQRLEHPAVRAHLYFAAPAYSSDNAVGVALLGRAYAKNCKLI